ASVNRDTRVGGQHVGRPCRRSPGARAAAPRLANVRDAEPAEQTRRPELTLLHIAYNLLLCTRPMASKKNSARSVPGVACPSLKRPADGLQDAGFRGAEVWCRE